MSILNTLPLSVVTQWLAWILIHCVWEGVLIAGLLWLVLKVIPANACRLRYVTGCFALTVVAAAPIATEYVLRDEPSWRIRALQDSPVSSDNTAKSEAVTPATRDVFETSGSPIEVSSAIVLPSVDSMSASDQVRRLINRSATWLVTAWLIGVIVSSIRLLTSFCGVQSLRASGRPIRDSQLQSAFARLLQQIQLQSTVLLLESAAVQVPTVIGWLKPVVLLPLTATTGLSNTQLEALLAHELAHVKRCDYLINLLQTLIETVLFYHPAVWWISSQIRNEREHCCDMIAVRLTANRELYASSLFGLAKTSCSVRRPIVAANGGNLVERIRRVLQVDTAEAQELRPGTLSGIMAVAGICSLIAVAGTAIQGATAQATGKQLLTTAAVQAPETDESPKSESSQQPQEPENTESTAEEKQSDGQTPADVTTAPRTVTFIIAKHVNLHEGRIVTWEQIEQTLDEASKDGVIYPQFYSTNGGLPREDELSEHRWKLYKKLYEAKKIEGMSIGSLSPRSGERYDRIQSDADLVPDPVRKLSGKALNNAGQPLKDVEVFLLPEQHINGVYLKDGRNRNPLEEHLVRSEVDGSFKTYPDDDEWYIAAAHPEGFAIESLRDFRTTQTLQLQPWARVTGDRPADEPADQQEIHFSCSPVPGISFSIYETEFSKDGSFEQKYLPPGLIQLQRSLPTGNGSSMSFPVRRLTLGPGESVEHSLGVIPVDQFRQAAEAAARQQ